MRWIPHLAGLASLQRAGRRFTGTSPSMCYTNFGHSSVSWFSLFWSPSWCSGYWVSPGQWVSFFFFFCVPWLGCYSGNSSDIISVYLIIAGLLFAIGQIFNYVISTHLCQATDGKINGALFETLFTLLSVVMVWIFWSSITEDDWPMPMNTT